MYRTTVDASWKIPLMFCKGKISIGTKRNIFQGVYVLIYYVVTFRLFLFTIWQAIIPLLIQLN